MAKKKYRVVRGKITISRRYGGDETKPITIRIEDVGSGTVIAEVNIALADFASALTGLSTQDCAIRFYGGEQVGKRREVKTERVFVPNDGVYEINERRRIASAALSEHEVNGWIGSVEDAINRHHRVAPALKDGGAFYQVKFHRFVDAPQEEESHGNA